MPTLLSLLLPSALAAEVTHLPPFLRGDFSVAYDYDSRRSTLIEGESEVGYLLEASHSVTYRAAFGVAPGAALYAELPSSIREQVGFEDVTTMIYDPVVETGNLVGGSSLDPAPYSSGRGLGGTWIGARATPFSAALSPLRGNLSTWLVDFGYRFIDETNFWTVDEDGNRGAGPGGPAWRFRNAFSTTYGIAYPYVEATFQREGWIEADLYDGEGDVITPGAVISPRSSLDLLFGSELIAWQDPVKVAFFGFDLRFGYGYASAAQIPSGIYLPSVLTTSEGRLVTTGEFSTFKTGLGFYYQPFQYMKFDVVADAEYYTPHRIEQPYEVWSGYDTLHFSGGIELEILIRSPEGDTQPLRSRRSSARSP